MAKIRAYVRVAQTTDRRGRPSGKYRIHTSTTKPSPASITDTSGNALPTVAFALDLVIPDDAFKQAQQVIAEVKIPEDALKIAAEVRHA